MYRCLVLDVDCQYLGISEWQDMIPLLLDDKVYPIGHYDKVVKSPSTQIQLPCVVMMKSPINSKTLKARTMFSHPTKRNVIIRDKYTCQWCGIHIGFSNCTLDHVMPKAMGGEHKITNVVACCQKCNNLKGDKLPSEFEKLTGLKLLNKPRQLSNEEKIECFWKLAKKKERKLWYDTLTKYNLNIY